VTPKYSIAIPVYNRSNYLRQALKSCLAQTASDFEVVISDDNSSEDLKAVAMSFSDPRVVYNRSDLRLGASKNHQRAVALSRGKYVTNLHSDDMLLPDYVQVAGRTLDSCNAAAATYCAAISLKGSSIDGWQLVPRIGFADRKTYLENPWLEANPNVIPSCCMFRKTAFDQIGGYRISLRFAYDWDLFMRFMTVATGVVFIPQILAIYRRHEEQASNKEVYEHLYDTLGLWKLKEYSHWTDREIAALVLSKVMRSLKTGVGLSELVSNVRRSGQVWRLVKGVPGAIVQSLARRMGFCESQIQGHFKSPTNVESAIRAANILMKNSGSSVNAY